MRRKWVGAGAIGAVVLLGICFALRRPLVVIFRGSGLDPAIPEAYRVPPSIDPELAQHSRIFEKHVYPVGKRVHSVVGYGLANIILIEGTDGIVIVDTGETVDQAEAVLAVLRKITDKPLAAIVLTHHHADHVHGTSVFLGEKPESSGKIPIFAHESLVKHYEDETGIIAELQAARSAHMYGAVLGPADREGGNNGIGPYLGRGAGGFVPPNRTFADKLDVTVAGIRMEMRYVPSEAESEIAIYLPDDGILLSAEVVQDHTFPNVYTIRGARYRDPVKWVRSLDVLREWPATAMVLQHGPPVIGKDEVARVLTTYRDEIQFVHDQAIRHMNKGLTPDELAEVVKLPPHLDQAHPWGRQYYGTVKHSVRNVYGGYLGWFAGDPVTLDPTPRAELAKRLVGLMGGRDKVLAAANRALDTGDAQFAAELATHLIRIDTKDEVARHLKASAFRKLGYAERNANYRNYYLVSAMELDGQFPDFFYLRGARQMLGGAMKGLPPDSQVRSLPTRLKAEETLDQDVVGGVRYPEEKATFRLHLRRGVLELSLKPIGDARFVVEATRATMGAYLSGESFRDAFGESTVEGDRALAERFFGWFETPFVQKPEVVVR